MLKLASKLAWFRSKTRSEVGSQNSKKPSVAVITRCEDTVKHTQKPRKNWLVSAPDCCWLPVGLVAEALALLASRWRNLSLVANRLWRTGSLVAPSRYFFTSQVLPPERKREKSRSSGGRTRPPNKAPQPLERQKKSKNNIKRQSGRECWYDKYG